MKLINALCLVLFLKISSLSFSQWSLQAGYDLNYLGDLEDWRASHTFQAGVEYILKDHFYFGLMINHRSIPIKSRTKKLRSNSDNNCKQSTNELDISIYTYGAYFDVGYINQVQEKTSLFIKLRFRPYSYYRLKTRKSSVSITYFDSNGDCEDLLDKEVILHSSKLIRTSFHEYERGFYLPYIPDLFLGVRKKWAEAVSSDFHIGFGLGKSQPIEKPRIILGFTFIYSIKTD